MQSDPFAETQRLTAHYRELGDDELRDLAADLADLTETAQQTLRTEMQSRGISDPLVATNAPAASNAPLAPRATYETSVLFQNRAGNASSFFARQPQLVPDTPDADAEPDGPVDYTWKTPLCDCDTSLQARELSAALKQAGIDSWIEAPETGSQYASFGLSSPRVLVAADQLDQARAIAAQPIPRQIVQDTQTEIPDYQPPSQARFRPIHAIDLENRPRRPQITPKTERAARQQGSSLLRENSSNGAKAIRTFWLHTRSGGKRCQEKMFVKISIDVSIL